MSDQLKDAQPPAQAGRNREAEGVTGEVGVLHSSVDLWESRTHEEAREGTCVNARKRSDGSGDGRFFRLPASRTLLDLRLPLLPDGASQPANDSRKAVCGKTARTV